jgi:ribosomal-protein-alanine N-acetyltransferase
VPEKHRVNRRIAVSIKIEPATVGQAQVIAEMSRRLVEMGLPWSWTPARVARYINDPDSVVLAARSGSSLAGFAIMHFGDDAAHLNLLAVDGSFQRRGLGRWLVGWLEQSALTAGTFNIGLEVRARNPVALLFYRRLGYVEVGRLLRYYSGREDAVRMVHDLRVPGTAHLQPPPPAVDGTPRKLAGGTNWLERFRR